LKKPEKIGSFVLKPMDYHDKWAFIISSSRRSAVLFDNFDDALACFSSCAQGYHKSEAVIVPFACWAQVFHADALKGGVEPVLGLILCYGDPATGHENIAFIVGRVVKEIPVCPGCGEIIREIRHEKYARYFMHDKPEKVSFTDTERFRCRICGADITDIVKRSGRKHQRSS